MLNPTTPKTEQQALVALALAVASFVAAPVLLGIAAIVIARGARRKIHESNGWLTGEQYCRLAVILGWVNIVLGVIFVLVALTMFLSVSGHGGGNTTFHFG